MWVAIGIENNGKGFAPITLASKEPVAQFVSYCGFATTLLCEPGVHCRFRIGNSVELCKRDAVVAGVHISAIANVGIWPFAAIQRWVYACCGKPL